MLIKNIKSKFEDTIKQAFKIYSSSNSLKCFIYKEKKGRFLVLFDVFLNA